MQPNELISLAQGGGGEAMRQLLHDLLLPLFDNPLLRAQEDQARLPLELAPGERLAFTTDSFVVTPLEFPGGDIGRLAVCGTLNDLAVGGARPHYLSCGLIIEEGLPLATLRRLCGSMAEACRQAGVWIVTGDTKVVPRGAADGLFINTSGVGVIAAGRDLGMHRIRPGDRLLVSGPVGDHGGTILACRQELALEVDLQSDCADLMPLIRPLLAEGDGVHALRDATRGGLSAVLHEFAAASGLCLRVEERAVPVRPAVRGLCELLGLEPLELACEGRFLAVVAADQAEALLASLKHHPLGAQAALIGSVLPRQASPVILTGPFGMQRALPPVSGELLPRIC